MSAKLALKNLSDEKPVSLILWVGSNTPPAVDGVTIADITPSSFHAQSIIEAFKSAGITSSDMRPHTVMAFGDNVDAATAVATYVAATTLAGRRLDAVAGTTSAALVGLDGKLRSYPASAKPDNADDIVQAGADHNEIPTVALDGPNAAEALQRIRHARRVRLAVASDVVSSLATFVAITALRALPGQERLPSLVVGNEPHDPESTVPAGFDLDTVRAGAFELRRSSKSNVTIAAAPVKAVSPRLQKIAEANAVQAETVFTALGLELVEAGQWRCPRSENHNNGDRKGSVRLEHNNARCMKCDAETMTMTRFVAAVKNISIDDAAETISAL